MTECPEFESKVRYSEALGHRCAVAGGVILLILGYQKSGATPTDYRANLLENMSFGWDTNYTNYPHTV
jgi:hypothetical protein